MYSESIKADTWTEVIDIILIKIHISDSGSNYLLNFLTKIILLISSLDLKQEDLEMLAKNFPKE